MNSNIEFEYVKTKSPQIYAQNQLVCGINKWKVRIPYTCKKSGKSRSVETCGFKCKEDAEIWSLVLRDCLEFGVEPFDRCIKLSQVELNELKSTIAQKKQDILSSSLVGVQCRTKLFLKSCLHLPAPPAAQLDVSLPVVVNHTCSLSPLQHEVLDHYNHKLNGIRKSLRLYEMHLREFQMQYKRLKQVLFASETHQLIISQPVTSDDPTEVIIDTDDPLVTPSRDDFSEKQLIRVNAQCTAVCEVFRAKVRKYHALSTVAEQVYQTMLKMDTQNATFYMIDHVQAQFRLQTNEIYESFDMSQICKGVLFEMGEYSERFKCSERTLRNWVNEYRTNSYAGFFEDLRGCWARDFFLEEEGLKGNFVLFMQTTKKLTVDLSREFLNQLLLSKYSDSLDTVLNRYRVKFPLSRRTVHRWMLLCGAKYEPYAQTYYTDSHDTKPNVEYRDCTYIPARERYSRRMAVWASVPLHLADTEALAHVRRVRGLAADAPLPTTVSDEGVVCTKVHVDYLSDKHHSTFRAECLQHTGAPGEFLFATHNGCPHLSESPCVVGHDPAVCKCYLRCVHIGQDEASFRQGLLSKMHWTVNGKGQLRMKGEGVGEMASAVQCEYRGLGFPMSEAEIKLVNDKRQLKGERSCCFILMFRDTYIFLLILRQETTHGLTWRLLPAVRQEQRRLLDERQVSGAGGGADVDLRGAIPGPPASL